MGLPMFATSIRSPKLTVRKSRSARSSSKTVGDDGRLERDSPDDDFPRSAVSRFSRTRRNDLFQVADLLAVITLAVLTTSGANMAARLTWGLPRNEQGVGDFVTGFGGRRIDPDCRVDTQLLAQNKVSEKTTQEAIAAMTLRYSPRVTHVRSRLSRRSRASSQFVGRSIILCGTSVFGLQPYHRSTP